MSGYSAAVIDPALQNLPPPRTTGMKRKARSTAPVNATPQATTTRVTRRQAAASAVSVPDPSSSITISSQHVDEPSRGEEENLMRYEWARETTKRSRRRSPSAHQPRGITSPGHASSGAAANASHPHTPHTPHTPQQSHTPAWAGSAQPSAHNSPGGPAAGIDNLAAAAAAYQSHPPRPRYPYPYGLTPFRYQCLTPHLPQPPPGDPANPAFKRFDPTHGSVEHQGHQGQQGHYHGSASASAVHSPASHNMTDRLPERTEHHTLAALLSATEAAGSVPSSRPRTPESRR